MSRPLGNPGLCDGHAFYGFLRVDLQISPVMLLSGLCVRCVLQCFAPVEANFFIDVSANSATACLGSPVFLLYFCKSPFNSSVNSTHRLLSLSRSGSVAFSSGATVHDLERFHRQKIVFFDVNVSES